MAKSCDTSIFNPTPAYEFPIRVDRTKSRRVMSATGIPFIRANRLTFNIMIGNDIALHFDIRIGYCERTVVINTRRNGVWGKEHRPATFPFKNDQFFLLEIDAGVEGFVISVNREHFAEYMYSYARFPENELCNIDKLEVTGDLRLTSVMFNKRLRWACQSVNAFQLKDSFLSGTCN